MWDRITKLCWEGFDKFRLYALEHYPNNEDSHNKAMGEMIDKFEGSLEDWDKHITEITKQEKI